MMKRLIKYKLDELEIKIKTYIKNRFSESGAGNINVNDPRVQWKIYKFTDGSYQIGLNFRTEHGIDLLGVRISKEEIFSIFYFYSREGGESRLGLHKLEEFLKLL